MDRKRSDNNNSRRATPTPSPRLRLGDLLFEEADIPPTTAGAQPLVSPFRPDEPPGTGARFSMAYEAPKRPPRSRVGLLMALVAVAGAAAAVLLWQPF